MRCLSSRALVERRQHRGGRRVDVHLGRQFVSRSGRFTFITLIEGDQTTIKVRIG
jgi:hypothetical protein